jgi:thymidylate synthase
MIPGACVVHDMAEGFPLVTVKKVSFPLVASELEFFLRGRTDKQWLQERNNHIYDHWCTPTAVTYGHERETQEKMLGERDLGPVTGFQWRHFGAKYSGCTKDYDREGVDQIANLIETLKTAPNSKRNIVSAWNPVDVPDMSLPPCPFAFGVNVLAGKLHLFFMQRSVDIMLGFPFDIAHHALLLSLLAQETGYKEGQLTAFFGNVALYVNHIEGARQILNREPHELPTLETRKFQSIFDWQFTDSQLKNYTHHSPIHFPVAV